MTKTIGVRSFLFFLVLAAVTLTGQAQTTSILTTDLILPNKVVTAGEHSLLVAETGTFTPNTGRISIVDRSTGIRQTLIDGLPSGVNDLGGPPAPVGPSGLVLHGHILYITIGSGDAVFSGGGPGLEVPNPTPSSPLFDSVLQLVLPGNYEDVTSEFVLSFANQATLAAGGNVTLTNQNDQTMSITMVANLPDYASEPVENHPENVRSTNLYGIDIFQKNLFLADASRNLIHKVNIETGNFSVFVVIPPRPNPEFPDLGAPVVEAVPDNIHRVGNKLLIPLLTGFPFPEDGAEILRLNLHSNEQDTFIDGLTTAIDVLHVEENDSYFTLEFSTDFLAFAPGRLRFYSSPDATPVNLVSNLVSPTSMARDQATGDIFVTSIFGGFLVRVSDLP